MPKQHKVPHVVGDLWQDVWGCERLSAAKPFGGLKALHWSNGVAWQEAAENGGFEDVFSIGKGISTMLVEGKWLQF